MCLDSLQIWLSRTAFKHFHLIPPSQVLDEKNTEQSRSRMCCLLLLGCVFFFLLTPPYASFRPTDGYLTDNVKKEKHKKKNKKKFNCVKAPLRK